MSLRTHGLANQWRAPAVEAIGKTIVEVIAPLASTERSGDEKNTQPHEILSGIANLDMLCGRIPTLMMV